MLRHATYADLPRIVEIYNAAIPDRLATADTEPVSVEARVAWFNRHRPDQRPLMVYETAQGILGWISFETFYGRPAYQATVELSVYVAREAQGQGVGRAMLGNAVRLAPTLGVKTLLAYIFSHNTPSLRLFQQFGFAEWGRLPAVAELDGIERDLSILGLRLGAEASSPAR